MLTTVRGNSTAPLWRLRRAIAWLVNVHQLRTVEFEVLTLRLSWSGMSDTDDAFTPEQLTELLLMQAETSARIVKDLGTAAHQSLAAPMMNALLLHELERVGLVDHDTVMAEAVQRAKSIHPPEIGASVSRVIMTVFDGEPPTENDPAGLDDSRTDVKH